VRALLTFLAPKIRQMAITNSIAPNTAKAAPAPINTETDTHRNFRLAFGDLQENPKFKLRNNF
jgi:hypothetical protein